VLPAIPSPGSHSGRDACWVRFCGREGSAGQKAAKACSTSGAEAYRLLLLLLGRPSRSSEEAGGGRRPRWAAARWRLLEATMGVEGRVVEDEVPCEGGERRPVE